MRSCIFNQNMKSVSSVIENDFTINNEKSTAKLNGNSEVYRKLTFDHFERQFHYRLIVFFPKGGLKFIINLPA